MEDGALDGFSVGQRVRNLISDPKVLASLKGDANLRSRFKEWVKESEPAEKVKEIQNAVIASESSTSLDLTPQIPEELVAQKTLNVWDNFDIGKIRNTAFCLQYTPPVDEDVLEFCVIEKI